VDQQPQQRFGQRRGQPEGGRGLAGPEHDFALALEIPRRQARRPLDFGDLAAQGLALGDQGQQFGVQAGQPGA
jgi:hypothetical protein